MIIRTGPGCEVLVDGLVVKNKGYVVKENEEGADIPEEVAIRGYVMEKQEAMEIIIEEPGKYVVDKDGNVEKL